MTNRREFVQVAALAAVPLSVGGGALAAQPFKGEAPARLYTVVYDDRFEDSSAFARKAVQLGLRTSAISGDVTDLWYHDLYHRWKKGPAAIAGLTTADALFVLETMGNDVGMRLVMKTEHRVAAGQVRHDMIGPAAILQQASLDQCGGAWSARMAQLASRCPATRANRIEASAVSHVDPLAASGPVRLVSWVIAPVSRA